MLTEYWGELTPAQLARLQAEGIDLDSISSPSAWEDVAETMRSQLCDLSAEQLETIKSSYRDWPSEMTPQQFEERFPIAKSRGVNVDEALVANVYSLVLEDNARVALAAEETVAQLDMALRGAWNSPSFLKSPVSTHAIEPTSRRAFYASACAHEGWGAKVLLYHDEHPELSASLDATIALRKERDQKIRGYISDLGR